MVKEETYNASKYVFTRFGRYFKDTSEIIGIERAIDIFTQYGKRDGEVSAQMLEDEWKDKELDLTVIGTMWKDYYEGIGYENKIEVAPTSIMFKMDKCPFYAGFVEAGVKHEDIEKMCRLNNKGYGSKLKLFDSNAGSRIVKFRSDIDDYCEEEITLK
jgi:hypothetical protein